jgi:hypothetical protein
MLPSVLVMLVSVNGRPSTGETIAREAEELNTVYNNFFALSFPVLKLLK